MASSVSIGKTQKWKSILRADTKGDMKNTAFKTLAYTGIGVIGGGLASALIGKPSFLIGLGLTGLGFYKDVKWLAPFGLGMMATSNPITNSVEGFSLKQETENAKERLSSFKDSLFSKTYMDKIFKGKTGSSTEKKKTGLTNDPESTGGFGSVEDNINALNQVEQQLVASAMEHQARSKGQRSSMVSPVEGMDDEPDFSGM